MIRAGKLFDAVSVHSMRALRTKFNYAPPGFVTVDVKLMIQTLHINMALV